MTPSHVQRVSNSFHMFRGAPWLAFRCRPSGLSFFQLSSPWVCTRLVAQKLQASDLVHSLAGCPYNKTSKALLRCNPRESAPSSPCVARCASGTEAFVTQLVKQDREKHDGLS